MTSSSLIYSFAGSDVDLAFGQKVGGAGQGLLDLSSTPLTIGSTTIDHGALSTGYLDLSGDWDADLGPASLSGNLALSINQDRIAGIASDADATLGDGDFQVGVGGASAGFVISDDNKVAIEATDHCSRNSVRICRLQQIQRNCCSVKPTRIGHRPP